MCSEICLTKSSVFPPSRIDTPASGVRSLYLIKFQDEPIIKIGTSGDVADRIRSFGVLFDLAESYVVESDNDAFINALEKTLHAMFQANRVTPARPLPNGNTELFEASVIDQVISKIPEIANLFPAVGWNLRKGITDIYPQDELSSDFVNLAQTIRSAIKL